MDAAQLIAPSSPLGFPAPYWFLVVFKVLGFTLHLVPMNLVFAGTLVALLLHRFGGADADLLSGRLMRQMPMVVAYGINFGVVPLLFTQVVYYKVFYPATILMAWSWLSVVVLLTVAYYGVYLYAGGLHGAVSYGRLRHAAGWMSAAFFLIIGLLFTNAFSLMVNVDAWPRLWLATSVAGAPMGTALNLGDPSLWPRWLMVFGLALMTVAAYVTVDSGFFAAGGLEAHRRWVAGFALKLHTLGFVWFVGVACWYVFGAWPDGLRQYMFREWRSVLMLLTAAAPALGWLLLFAQTRSAASRGVTISVGVAQFGVLALNAVSRQIVQNAELRAFVDVTSEAVKLQWSPLLLFLALFVAGVAVISWMLGQVAAGQRERLGHPLAAPGLEPKRAT